MATSTERFGFTLPSGQDPASVVPLNLNTQNIEKYLGMTQDMLAPLYDAIEGTYEVDDIVTHDSVLYKCIEAVETPEAFDETKWVQTTAVSEGGGASNVEANPTGTPTDTLNTIGINGTIYGIEGSGGGEGYTETTIWSGSETTNKWAEPIVLNDVNVDDYDALAIQVNMSQHIVSTAQIPNGDSSGSSYIAVNGFLNTNGESVVGIWLNKGNNLLRIFTATNVTIVVTKVVGIKYATGGGGSISGEGVEIYSESEYIVGKWIDGKKVYQKTINFGAMPAQGDSKSVAHNISDIDKIISWEAFGVNASGLVIFVPNISRGNVASQTSMSADRTNVDIYNGSSSDLTDAYNGYITIRYTKIVETPAPAWGGSVTNNYANFIDTDNVIQAETQVSSGTTGTYTATEDCYIRAKLWRSSEGGASLSIDGVEVLTNYSNSGTSAIYNTIPLKKGQTATIDAGAGSPCSYTVYGITYGSGGSETPATDASEVEYNNTTSQLTADNVQEAIDEVVANAGTASEDILTLQNVQGYDEYDETQTYAVGDYAIYNNIVYECTTAVSTAEPFDSTKWTATSIEQIIDGVKGDISQLNSSLPKKLLGTLPSTDNTFTIEYPSGLDKNNMAMIGFGFYRNASWYFNTNAVSVIFTNANISVTIPADFSYIKGLPYTIIYIKLD